MPRQGKQFRNECLSLALSGDYRCHVCFPTYCPGKGYSHRANKALTQTQSDWNRERSSKKKKKKRKTQGWGWETGFLPGLIPSLALTLFLYFCTGSESMPQSDQVDLCFSSLTASCLFSCLPSLCVLQVDPGQAPRWRLLRPSGNGRGPGHR